MKEFFKKIITDFHERKLPRTVTREIDIPLNPGKIVSLVGVRRSGKTCIAYQLIEKLRERDDSTRIVYVNFEDDRLFPLQLSHLNDLIEAYYELYPDNRKGRIWLFFDEIQNVENWELFVRRISTPSMLKYSLRDLHQSF